MKEFGATTSLRGAALAAAFALTTSGCDRQSASDLVVPSTYEIVRANGAELPATLASDSGCITQLTSGTLNINERDYRSNYVIRRTCALNDVRRMPDRGVVGSYRINGDSIFFVNAEGKHSGAGVFGADTVVIRGPLHELTFRRTNAEPSTSF